MQESQEFLRQKRKTRTWMSPRSAPEQNSGARALPSDARHGFHGDVQEEGPEGFGPGVAVQDAHGDAGRGPPDPRCARVANESATRHIPPKAPPSRARTTSRPNARGRGARDVLYAPRTRRDDRDSRPTDPDDGPSPDGPSPRPATTQTSSARRRVSRNPSRIALSATTCEACVFWRRRSSRPAGRSRAYTKTRRR